MGSGEWGMGSLNFRSQTVAFVFLFLLFQSHSFFPSPLPTPHFTVSSCHHPWTAWRKLIISCGHIFDPICNAASSICGVSSAIYILSPLHGRLPTRWHERCFTLSR